MTLIQFRNICISLFLVSFFFFPRLQTLFIGSAFLITFFTSDFSNFKAVVLTNKLSWAVVIYFLLTLFSMLYTSDFSEGWKGLEIKFSMLVFPLFLPVIFHQFTTIDRQRVLTVLTVSALAYVLFSFIRAVILFYSNGDSIVFKSVYLGFRLFQSGPFVHPTYVSIYYIVLILVWGKYIIDKGIEKRTISIFFMNLLFLVFIFFSSSKAGILLAVIIIISLLVYFVKKKKKVIVALVFFFAFTMIGTIGIVNSSLKTRFVFAYQEMTAKQEDPDSYVLQSTGARIWVWKSTMKLIEENPILGVGVGDIRTDLTKKNREAGITDESILRLDSHQQYLQTTATLGFLGLISLMLIFVSLFYYGKKNRHFILFCFAIIYFLFGFTESMLETQAGIIFFVFFSFFFVSQPNQAYDERN